MARRSCEWCGTETTYAKGRCRACYEYLTRTNKDRPEDLIVKEIERSLTLSQT